MYGELLTVDQVAKILELHPRTVLRFIRDGRLKATKLGKQWRIQRRDLNALTESGAGGAEAEGGRGADRVQASAVVDVRVDTEDEASRIFTSMLAAVTGKGPEYGAVHYQSLYLRDEGKARLMFWGDPSFIGGALLMAHKLSTAIE